MYKILIPLALALALTGCGIPLIDIDVPLIPGI